MQSLPFHIFPVVRNCVFVLLFLIFSNGSKAQSGYGKNDTIYTAAVVFEGDTIEAKTLAGVYLSGFSKKMSAKAKWTRLRNAVYVTYPYAKRAGIVFNDINRHLEKNPGINKGSYVKTREKEL